MDLIVPVIVFALIIIIIIVFIIITALFPVDHTTGCCTQRLESHEYFVDTSVGIENGNMCRGTDVAVVTYRHRDGSRAHICVHS